MDPGKVIGIVFNGDDRPLSRYYGYYYGYGHRGQDGRRGNGWRTLVGDKILAGLGWRRRR